MAWTRSTRSSRPRRAPVIARSKARSSSGSSSRTRSAVAEGRANKLKIDEEVTDKIRVVALHGSLDMETAEGLQGRLAGGAAAPNRPLGVDLPEAWVIDSVGLSALLQGAKPLQNGESNVAFVAPGGVV